MLLRQLTLMCLALGLLGPAAVRAESFLIAVPDGPVSLPLLVALNKRLFAAEGLDARRVPCASGKACLELLRSGAAEVAASAEFAVAAMASQKTDLVILASVSESSDQIKVIANRRAGVSGSPDLAGKRIATVGGTSAQYLLDQWLVYQGIDPSQITQILQPPDALAASITQGGAAAVVIWEPEATRIQEQLGDDALRMSTENVYRQHFCVVARSPSVERGRQRFEAFLRGLLRAERFIVERPAEARAILAASLKVSAQVAQRLMSEQDYRLSLKPSLATTMLSQVRWHASRVKTAGNSPTKRISSLKHLVDPSLLQSLAPQAVSHVR